MCQTWASIESKQWIVNNVIPGVTSITDPYASNTQGSPRADWNGDWSTTTAWNATHFPVGNISPLDSPTFEEYGSGPYILDYLDPATNDWAMSYYPLYWGGWPASYPALGPVEPAGYCTTVEESWGFDWSSALSLYTTGAADFVALPAVSDISQFYGGSANGNYYPVNTLSIGPNGNYLPLNGTMDIAPLPMLEVDACYMTYSISSGPNSGTLLSPGTYGPNGIPSDFFGNTGIALNGQTNGLDIRQAFAYSFNYTTYIAEAFSGLATVPATAIIPGLEFYNLSIASPYYLNNTVTPLLSLAKAQGLLYDVDGGPGNPNSLWNKGFTITITYNSGNAGREDGDDLLAAALESMHTTAWNSTTLAMPGPITVIETPIDWNPYLLQMTSRELSCFFVGWLADYPDPNDFAFPFYDSSGTYGYSQAYADPNMDGNVTAASLSDVLTVRQTDYNNVMNLAISDCPSFPIDQPFGFHLQHDWVQGWYYNAVYPGEFFYNIWKAYYLPAYNAPDVNHESQPNEYQTEDVNHDGKINIVDVSAVAKAFGTIYGVPGWIYVGDINNDRKINIVDVSFVAKLFGTTNVTSAGLGHALINGTTYSFLYWTGPYPESATFKATYTGTQAVLGYQWFLNNQAVGTGQTYVYTCTGSGHIGSLQVVISLAGGQAVTSGYETIDNL